MDTFYFVLILVLQTFPLITGEESGPYKIVLESITNCVDKGEIFVESEARKEENEIFHTGDLSFPFGLTDSFEARGEVRILKNGQWEPIGFISELDFPQACSSMKSFVPVWFDILKAANVENVECPIKEGTYHFVDYQVKESIGGFNELTFGEYRARITFFNREKVFGCIAYHAQVEPIA